MKYDYLIVGCGLYGATIARKCLDHGKSVLIIDKRKHIGGNVYTEKKDGIDIHKYGPHIFHTSSEKIWKFVNQFTEFNNYRHKVIANYNNNLYSLPFNMWTFYQFWGVRTPEEALSIINKQKFRDKPSNLEEQALSLVGYDIYHKLIKNYTIKQWQKDPKELPASIIKRLPVRFTYDDNYFNDIYQGIPIDGYTKMISRMIDGSVVELETDFFDKRDYWESIASRIIYTGPIDRFYDYEFGKLDYRSLRFEESLLDCSNFQGLAQVNFTDSATPYTRIIEHKHFIPNNGSGNTVVTKEYSQQYDHSNEPYYPINDEINNITCNKYKNLSKTQMKYIFGGRLAEYRYYDMHQVIGAALNIDI
jgi:UDP-galactopyranose mutase